jgi:hypothetical protein
MTWYLGMDWLEAFSPMEVDWKNKWISFHSNGKQVKLQGIVPNISCCNLINVEQLEGLLKNEAVEHLLEAWRYLHLIFQRGRVYLSERSRPLSCSLLTYLLSRQVFLRTVVMTCYSIGCRSSTIQTSAIPVHATTEG